MQKRPIVQRVWAWLGADRRLVEVFIALVATYLLILVLPQSPVPTQNRTAFSLWLAELRPTLGDWRKPLATLGLLTLRTSIWMRTWVAALSLILSIRLGALIENWRELSGKCRWQKALIVTGMFLFTAGWGMQTLWAWSEPNLAAWPGMELTIPDRNITLPSPQPKFRLWYGRYGLYLLPQDASWGLEIRAIDSDEPLSLLATLQSAPQEHLRITLTSQNPETYFALAEENLIFRTSLLTGTNAGTIQLQAYRGSTELLTTTLSETEQDIEIENVQLQLTRVDVLCFHVIYNPGALFQILGGLLSFGGYGTQVIFRKDHDTSSELPETTSSQEQAPPQPAEN